MTLPVSSNNLWADLWGDPSLSWFLVNYAVRWQDRLKQMEIRQDPQSTFWCTESPPLLRLYLPIDQVAHSFPAVRLISSNPKPLGNFCRMHDGVTPKGQRVEKHLNSCVRPVLIKMTEFFYGGIYLHVNAGQVGRIKLNAFTDGRLGEQVVK